MNSKGKRAGLVVSGSSFGGSSFGGSGSSCCISGVEQVNCLRSWEGW